MLLDLLSDTYLIFRIKINDDSCDLLFHTHLFPYVDSKECLWACTYGFKHFSGLQSSLGITNGNRSHNKPLELI